MANQGYPQVNPGYPPPPPPPPPYQGYSVPYHSYSGQANGYPYTAPPHATYYSAQVYGAGERSSSSSFGRVMLALLIVFLVGALSVLIISWIVLGEDTAEFRVESMSVPSFNVTDSLLKATWEANVTVKNKNKKRDVFFYYVQSSMSYNDNLLALTLMDPFHLGKDHKRSIFVKLGVDSEQNGVGNYVLKEIGRDRNAGKVTFDLKFNVEATFGFDSRWRREVKIRVYCDDLAVGFPTPNGPGTMAGSQDCRARQHR